MGALFKNVCEGFALETQEGLIFTVKGCVHPHDRFIAYLRYVPDPAGDRRKKGKTYRRIYRFADQAAVLERRYPHYLGTDPCFDLPVQWVETCRIRKVYDPVRKLERICRSSRRNRAEQTAADFTDLLKNKADIAPTHLGISGSVLYGLDRPESDLDMVVYGDGPSRAVHLALVKNRAAGGSASDALGLDTGQLRRLHATHCPDTPLSFETFAMHQNRKINEGMFHGRPYFIRFVKHPEADGPCYNDPCYRQKGRATLTARVVDDTDAIFTPCTYTVADSAVFAGPGVDDLREIVSFRGRFTDQLRTGEQAVARGTLETVMPRNAQAYSRLVVGGTVGDYLMRHPDKGA